MTSINKLINKISDFRCEVDGIETIFPGILKEDNGNIILNAKFPLEQYRKIGIENDITVLGEVSGRKATLMGCHITSASCAIGDNDISICAVPNEIIVGGCFTSTPMVNKISVKLPELNYMFFGSSPLELNYDFTKENPGVLNCTYPKAIQAKDKYGEIKLYQSFDLQWSVNDFTHTIISVVEYSFTNLLPLMDAVTKVYIARSLFSFFGNGYISFGDITFEIDGDENVYGLWLNYKEDIPAVNEPFLIGTSAFENQFQEVWEAWLALYESANPIPTLFYEIVRNSSTETNSFLNLSKAIELYSRIFRNDEANDFAENDLYNESKGKGVKLKHRYQDILSEYNDSLGLIESNIEDYAKGFSNMRNYYTHYNSVKYVEPTYDELYSASHILRFVLLTIVYTAVGIPKDCILKCKEMTIFSRFDEDAKAILNYSKK